MRNFTQVLRSTPVPFSYEFTLVNWSHGLTSLEVTLLYLTGTFWNRASWGQCSVWYEDINWFAFKYSFFGHERLGVQYVELFWKETATLSGYTLDCSDVLPKSPNSPFAKFASELQWPVRTNLDTLSNFFISSNEDMNVQPEHTGALRRVGLSTKASLETWWWKTTMRRIGAASAAVQSLYQSVVVKTKLELKVSMLSIYQSDCGY